MQLQKIGILDDGTLLLPDELRESLKNTPDLWMAWNDDLIVINRKFQDESLDIISQQKRIQRFFNTADRLSPFNEFSPISEAEIKGEIEAYRAEKRTTKKDGV